MEPILTPVPHVDPREHHPIFRVAVEGGHLWRYRIDPASGRALRESRSHALACPCLVRR